MQQQASRPFRFEAETHSYLDIETGDEIAHITGLLLRSGWVDDRFFTEEGSERGTAVHGMTAQYDLGSHDVEAFRGQRYVGYLLSHVKAVSMIKPTWITIEQPRVHPTLRFGGRPDREAILWGIRSVLEGKSGEPQQADLVQTALQAILVAPWAGLPPEAIARFGLYWRANGKYRLEEFKDRRDFDEARRILKRYC